MVYEKSPIFNYVVIALLLLNLGITSYTALRSTSPHSLSDASKAELNISEADANALAAEITKLYNAKDDVGLFNKFDSIAKAQLSKEKFKAELDQLYPLMGTISDSAFSSSVLAGSEEGRDYYNLNYKIKLTDGQFNSGDLKLTVTQRESGLGLVGFFINGTSHHGGK